MTDKWIARQMVSGAWEIADDDTASTIAHVLGESDAHLAAAAPTMRAALIRAADMFEQVACMMDDTGASGGPTMRAAADEAREAIRIAAGPSA